MTSNGSVGVEAVERALHLLEAFDDPARPLGLADLARRSGLAKSTTLRILASLIRCGFVVRIEDGRYRLGPSLWRLGALYRAGVTSEDTIRPILADLSEATGETASFYVRHDESRICLYRHEPRRPIRHAITEGAAMPLDGGASAIVLRAWQGRAPEDDATRARGYAHSRGARDPEVAAIAVPVLRGGTLLGALALSGPIARFEVDGTEDRVIALRRASEQIAKE
jgi:DNA-binding IclR family transcriptional regulator